MQLLKTPKLIAASAYPSSAGGQFGSNPTKASRLHPLLAFVFAGLASTLATSTQANYTLQTLAGTATEQRTEQAASGTNRLQSHSHTYKAAGSNASHTTTQDYPRDASGSLKPQGRLDVIDDMQGLDAMPLKGKALSLHWEMMFTRPMFETPDMGEQCALLAEVAALVDVGRVRSTVSTSFGRINVHNLRKAHALIESGKAHGKVVLAGF